MNVDIYQPRLDVPFKKSDVPKERYPISDLRLNWKKFVKNLALFHFKHGDNIRIMELPLWQITEELVSKQSINANRIYIPHKMKANWYLDERIYYYMQMVIPYIFSIDTQGWCASASNWPIAADQWIASQTTPDIFDKLVERVKSNISKFAQPISSQDKLPPDFIFFPCQLPHDETIRFHSDVSVEDSLTALLTSLRSQPNISIVIKGHPANELAMQPLKSIYHSFKKEYAESKLQDKLFWVDNISIHQALAKCKAVFTVNSGVGLEALLHFKQVLTFGNADYASASKKIIFGGNIVNAASAISRQLELIERQNYIEHQQHCRSFINSWYYSNYHCDDYRSFLKLAAK